MPMDLVTVPDIQRQLGGTVYKLLGDLLIRLDAKRARNRLRADYYDMKNLFKDLRISIPPHLRNLEVSMGWPAKAVDLLARRIKLEGFVLPGGDVADFGIDQIVADNHFDRMAAESTISTLINTPSCLMTTMGDPELGEPEIVISAHDAFHATGFWDPARRALSSALIVLDDQPESRRLLLFTPVAWADLRSTDNRNWQVIAERHDLGRVPVEPLTYKSRLGRPFGSSRISRAMMTITNSAMRTVVRSEVGAEFFSAPQRYLLGADEEMFVDASGNRKSVWDLVMGRILAVPPSDDPESDKAMQIGQFDQISMTPHTEHFRMWAMMFAGEASLPVNSLGITMENPPSAESFYAAKEDLILEAEATCDGMAPAWIRSMRTGVELRDGALPPELTRLGVRWRDPSTPSRAQSTDAVMKQVQTNVLPADSDVTLELLGYDETTIARIQADRRRAAGREILAGLVRNAPSDATDSGQLRNTLTEQPVDAITG